MQRVAIGLFGGVQDALGGAFLLRFSGVFEFKNMGVDSMEDRKRIRRYAPEKLIMSTVELRNLLSTQSRSDASAGTKPLID